MAQYDELQALMAYEDLKGRVSVACIISAETILNESPADTGRQVWAARTLADPETEAARMLNVLLAANSAQTVGQIKTATDSQIQTRVDAAIPSIVAGDEAIRKGT